MCHGNREKLINQTFRNKLSIKVPSFVLSCICDNEFRCVYLAMMSSAMGQTLGQMSQTGTFETRTAHNKSHHQRKSARSSARNRPHPQTVQSFDYYDFCWLLLFLGLLYLNLISSAAWGSLIDRTVSWATRDWRLPIVRLWRRANGKLTEYRTRTSWIRLYGVSCHRRKGNWECPRAEVDYFRRRACYGLTLLLPILTNSPFSLYFFLSGSITLVGRQLR